MCKLPWDVAAGDFYINHLSKISSQENSKLLPFLSTLEISCNVDVLSVFLVHSTRLLEFCKAGSQK